MIKAEKILNDYKAREEISDLEMARRLGISRPTYSKLIKGEDVNMKVVESVCVVTGCQPKDIVKPWSE